jgi:hypothetical protein
MLHVVVAAAAAADEDLMGKCRFRGGAIFYFFSGTRVKVFLLLFWRCLREKQQCISIGATTIYHCSQQRSVIVGLMQEIKEKGKTKTQGHAGNGCNIKPISVFSSL